MTEDKRGKNFHFVEIDENSSSMLKDFVANQFEAVIKPLYGDQTEPLRKIFAAADRKSWLMFDGKFNNTTDNAVGFICVKTVTQTEYKLNNCLEIKTLFVINSTNNSGRGCGSSLLNKVESFVNDDHNSNIIKGECEHLLVCVDDRVVQSKKFFLKKGFSLYEIRAKNQDIFIKRRE